MTVIRKINIEVEDDESLKRVSVFIAGMKILRCMLAEQKQTTSHGHCGIISAGATLNQTETLLSDQIAFEQLNLILDEIIDYD